MFELTDEAIAGIDRLASRYRITKTALVEALGQLAQSIDLPPEVVERAHDIDKERRSRR